MDDSVGICSGVGVSFGWVSGGCGGDTCWFYYITCKGVRRIGCRSALLKCILGGGGGSGSCCGGAVDVVFVVVLVVIIVVVVVVVLVLATGFVGVAVAMVEKLVYLGLCLQFTIGLLGWWWSWCWRC